MGGVELKEHFRGVRDAMSETHRTRLHRAISWLICADSHADDADVRFISYWIAFNSCYSADGLTNELTARQSFQHFTKQLVELDSDKKIYNCLWMNYSGFVKAIINNEFVFNHFWDSQRNGDDTWQRAFDSDKKKAMRALANEDVPALLGIVMDRLYVLRNQLMHGGATYQSGVNRTQVTDAGRLLSELLPIVIEIMMEQHEADWGEIFYPVVNTGVVSKEANKKRAKP